MENLIPKTNKVSTSVAARIAGVKPNTIRVWVKRGKISGERSGHAKYSPWVFSRDIFSGNLH